MGSSPCSGALSVRRLYSSERMNVGQYPRSSHALYWTSLEALEAFFASEWLGIWLQSSVLITAQAPASVSTSPTSAPPLDPKLFEPTNRTTGLLNPNPVNPTCEVLLDIKTVNTTGPAQQQPSASQVASSVQSNISMQIANLNATEFEVRL